jgi:hypothetical protein
MASRDLTNSFLERRSTAVNRKRTKDGNLRGTFPLLISLVQGQRNGGTSRVPLMCLSEKAVYFHAVKHTETNTNIVVCNRRFFLHKVVGWWRARFDIGGRGKWHSNEHTGRWPSTRLGARRGCDSTMPDGNSTTHGSVAKHARDACGICLWSRFGRYGRTD